jgi:hypothetical protein
MVFKEIIAVYTDKHAKPINLKYRIYQSLKWAGHVLATGLQMVYLS